MRTRGAGAAVGVVFGFVLTWSGMADPDVIREALILEDSYLYLMFASAVATATVGLRALRAVRRRALLNDAELTWSSEPPQRRHVSGALLFGVGWGVAAACPGPIATQIGQGVPWAVFTLAGVALGIWVFLRRSAIETEPASRPAPDVGTAAHGAA